MKVLIQTLRRHNQKIAGFFTVYAILAVIATVAGILVTRLTGEISQAALEFDTDLILRFLGVMAIFTAIQAVAACASAYISGRKQANTTHALRKSFARHFIGIEYRDLDGKNSGGYLSLFSNDLPATSSLLSKSSLDMVSGAISALAALAFMATINPVQTLIFFLMFPLLVMLQAKISMPIQKKAMERSTARARFNAVVNDCLQNTNIVVAYSLENALEARYLDSYDEYYRAGMGYVRALLVLVIGGIIATLLPTVYIIAVSGIGVAKGSMTISQFIAFTSVSGIAGGWLSMLSQNLNWFQGDIAGAVKINEAMSDPLEDITTGSAEFPGGDIAVKLENVTFAYPGGKTALDGVSLEIKPGEKIALVGGSGSGKSTILKLLLALYVPDSGEIYVSGADTRHVSRQALRHHLAYVPQDGFLFPESIRENMLPQGTKASQEQLEEACRAAEILDFISQLPRGFDTVLSESAENVSGGQRQRLAIARGFLQDSPIVLLDESTSALDPATEKAVLSRFDTLMKDKTVIMVAHRLSAIEACQRIIVMDGGRVAGTGTHQELLASNSAYRAIYESFARQEEGAGV